MSSVGIIGLGAMGLPIAKHIVEHRELNFYARRDNVINEMSGCGGQYYDSSKTLGANCDVVILLVVNYEQCLNVLEGEQGLFQSGFHGTLIVMSTIGLKEIKELEITCRKYNITVLDSPISGGVLGAQNGTITTIISGDQSAYSQVEELLRLFSSNVFYLGDRVGDAQVVKAMNQLLVGVNILASAEVFHYVDQLNIENRQLVFDILKESAGSSHILKTRGQSLVDRKFDTGKSSIDIHTKDLNICLDIAKEANISTFLTSSVYEFFKDAVVEDRTKNDAVSIIEYFDDL